MVAPKCLCSMTSFSLQEDFLDKSDSLVRCVLHQNINVFIKILYANVMRMSKLISLLEANQGIRQEERIPLNDRMCQKALPRGRNSSSDWGLQELTSFRLNDRLCPKTLPQGRNSSSNWEIVLVESWSTVTIIVYLHKSQSIPAPGIVPVT